MTQKRMTVLLAFALALTISPLAAFAQTAAATSETRVIVTQGEAVVKHPPDRAWVSVAVEGRAGKSADARNQAALQMTAVQTAVKGAGVLADDIKTTNFSIHQNMEWDGTRSRAGDYVARNSIEVRVDNLDILSAVLDAAGNVRTSGAQAVTISGIRFDLKKPEAVEQEALTLAVKDAMTRAQAMARAAGVSVGNVVRMEEQRQSSRPGPIPYMMKAEMARAGDAAATPIEPNEIEVRAMVTVHVGLR